MTALGPDLRKVIIECFEARGYQVEFKEDHILVTRGGKVEKISNETIMRFIEAFDPKD